LQLFLLNAQGRLAVIVFGTGARRTEISSVRAFFARRQFGKPLGQSDGSRTLLQALTKLEIRENGKRQGLLTKNARGSRCQGWGGRWLGFGDIDRYKWLSIMEDGKPPLLTPP